jgi:hypothetical protein
MRTISTVVTVLALTLLLVGQAAARQPSRSVKGRSFDGGWARKAVVSYYQDRGMNTSGLRVHAVRPSHSGKSTQVAVQTGSKVRLFNVLRRNSKVSATRTGLISQSRAVSTAHQQIKRYQSHLRTGAFLKPAGLSTTGRSYKLDGQSGRRRNGGVRYDAYVTLRKGTLNNVAIK